MLLHLPDFVPGTFPCFQSSHPQTSKAQGPQYVPETTFSLFPYVAEMIQFKYTSWKDKHCERVHSH